MTRVAGLQQPDGLWRSSLLDPESYPGGESSGTGFYIYAMAWGVNNKILDRGKFLPVIKKAWLGLNSLVHADGKVGWTQPIGRTRGKISMPRVGKFMERVRISWRRPRSLRSSFREIVVE